VKYVKQYNVNGVVKMEVKVEGEDNPPLSGNNENEIDQGRTGGWDIGNNENEQNEVNTGGWDISLGENNSNNMSTPSVRDNHYTPSIPNLIHNEYDSPNSSYKLYFPQPSIKQKNKL